MMHCWIIHLTYHFICSPELLTLPQQFVYIMDEGDNLSIILLYVGKM